VIKLLHVKFTFVRFVCFDDSVMMCVSVQLYDMSPDPKRKEFLDDLFSLHAEARSAIYDHSFIFTAISDNNKVHISTVALHGWPITL